jgi:dTMP kinase
MTMPSTSCSLQIGGRKRKFPAQPPALSVEKTRKWIRETVAQGYTIVCDRYVYSGMIYSAAKKNPELNIGWAKQCDEGLPRPDMVVFLDLELAEAERRGGYGEEKYEKREMQERVKELFAALRVAGGDEAEDMQTIDAGFSIEDVAEKVYELVLRRVMFVESGHFKGLGKVTPWTASSAQSVAGFEGR